MTSDTLYHVPGALARPRKWPKQATTQRRAQCSITRPVLAFVRSKLPPLNYAAASLTGLATGPVLPWARQAFTTPFRLSPTPHDSCVACFPGRSDPRSSRNDIRVFPTRSAIGEQKGSRHRNVRFRACVQPAEVSRPAVSSLCVAPVAPGCPHPLLGMAVSSLNTRPAVTTKSNNFCFSRVLLFLSPIRTLFYCRYEWVWLAHTVVADGMATALPNSGHLQCKCVIIWNSNVTGLTPARRNHPCHGQTGHTSYQPV